MNSQTAVRADPPASSAPKISWLFRLIAAGILGMTLPFKFSGAAESVALFETLGAEPWGRLGTGAFEAVAVILLLVPRTAGVGGVLALGLMSGAIISHLKILGINYGGDASLFTLACVAFVSAALVALMHRRELPFIGHRF